MELLFICKSNVFGFIDNMSVLKNQISFDTVKSKFRYSNYTLVLITRHFNSLLSLSLLPAPAINYI